MMIAGNGCLSRFDVVECRHDLMFLLARMYKVHNEDSERWCDPRYAGVHMACFAMTGITTFGHDVSMCLDRYILPAVAHLNMGDVIDEDTAFSIASDGMENQLWEDVVRRPAVTWLRRWCLCRSAARRWRRLTKMAIAARVIQCAWRRIIVDPTTRAGHNRLVRWFRELQDDMLL